MLTNVELYGIISENKTILLKFIYSAMKNNHFPGNQDYKCVDTGLIAILDVIKSTRYNYAGDLKLSDKGCFFHQSYVF